MMSEQFVAKMQSPEAWDKSASAVAKSIDRHYRYDKLEFDLGFFYFTDGSVAGIKPKSHQAWCSQ